jgi:Ca2+:H+ antiporter
VHAEASPPESGFSRREMQVFAGVAAVSLAAVGVELAGVPSAAVFAVAGVAVAGLAYILGIATERAGESTGPRIASLLNATFGNLPELIIVILTLNAGLITVARTSIVGSVLGNVLFILGFSIMAGGLKNGRLSFNSRVMGVNASMLVIAVVALAVPTVFDAQGGGSASETQILSDTVAVIMLLLYVGYLIYQFQHPDPHASHGTPRWTMRGAVVTLMLTAIATGVLSEILVSSIEPTI